MEIISTQTNLQVLIAAHSPQSFEKLHASQSTPSIYPINTVPSNISIATRMTTNPRSLGWGTLSSVLIRGDPQISYYAIFPFRRGKTSVVALWQRVRVFIRLIPLEKFLERNSTVLPPWNLSYIQEING